MITLIASALLITSWSPPDYSRFFFPDWSLGEAKPLISIDVFVCFCPMWVVVGGCQQQVLNMMKVSGG